MAANANSGEEFQKLYSVFTSLNEELKRWYIACIQQRREVESRVQLTRKLLKPWPLKNKENVEPSSTNPQSNDKDVNKDQVEEAITNPDMELLDKILEKAQRAREIQNKLDALNAASGTRKPSKTNQATLTDTKTSNALDIKKTKPNKPGETTNSKIKTKTVGMTTKSQPTSHPSTSKAFVKQPVLLRKNKQTTVKTTYGAAYGKSGSSSRPGSGAKNSQTTRSGGGAVSNQDAKDKNKPKAKPSKPTASNATTAEEKKQNTIETSDNSTEPSLQSPSQENIEDSTPEDTDFVQRAKRELSRISTDLKEVNVRKQELSKREENQAKQAEKQTEKQPHEKNDTEAELSQADKPFVLTEDGHTLILPSKYRKLKSSHNKLIYKLAKTSRTSDQSSENFLKRLESHFDLTEAPREIVLEKTKSLAQGQKKLELYVQWLMQRSKGCETDSFSWQNIYKTYRHWQLLLGKFRELQKQTQQLLAVEEYQQRWCPCGGCITTKEMSSHFHKPKETNENQTGQTPTCVLYSSWMNPVSSRMHSTQEDRPNLDPVTYKSEKELHMLSESFHNLEVTTVDLYIQKHIGEKTLDVLERMDNTHRNFPSIYRALWGLMCCDGKAFPSVVQDNSGD